MRLQRAFNKDTFHTTCYASIDKNSGILTDLK